MQDGVVLWGNRLIETFGAVNARWCSVMGKQIVMFLNPVGYLYWMSYIKAIQGFHMFQFTHIHSDRQWTQLCDQ